MLRAELKVVGGKHDGKVIPLTTKKFLIGREEDCHLRPNSDMVSRHHCVFTLDDFSLRLRDLGSTNGTQINGERLRGQTVLNAGDTISIGNLGFEVRIDKSSPIEPIELPGGGPETVELSASETMSMRALDSTTHDETTVMPVAPVQAPIQLAPVEQEPILVEAVAAPVAAAPQAAPQYQPQPEQQQPAYAPQPAMDPAYAQQGYMPMPGLPMQQPMGYPQPGMMYPQQGYGYPQQGYMPQPGMLQPGMAYPQQAYGAPQQMVPQPEAPQPQAPQLEQSSSRRIPTAPIKLPPPESTGAHQ
ncbi:MAG: FHA domain-containing protein [Planctomycetota bacterium]|nr:FHA domain-containing protein [Planctomycetota bacterium]